MNGMARMVFWAAIVAGTSYYFAHDLGATGPLAIVWKGAGVTLLAIWCAMQARSRDGWLIAAVMAFGALGDVLIETAGTTTGAAAFAMGHIGAIWLYLRNRRLRVTISQRLLVVLLVPLSLLVVMLITTPSERLQVAVYTLLVAGMAASAWGSRFSRYRVGIGAIMFLLSDLIIVALLGALTGPVPPIMSVSPPALLIWPLYFGGQVLIAWGVTRTLAHDGR